MSEWIPKPGEFPWAPVNGQVVSTFFTGAVDIRWDDPSLLATGSTVLLTAASGTLTVTGTPVLGDTVTIALFALEASSARTEGGMNFAVGDSEEETAQSLCDAINDPLNYLSFVSATVSDSTVTITASQTGTDGNAIAITTSSDFISLSSPSLTGGTGDPASCQDQNNAAWAIVGVNVYRSDTGDRGPYVRLNRYPIGSLFYRDTTENVFVQDEIVDWDGAWTSKGDTANDRCWSFCTIFCPVAKPTVHIPGVADRVRAVPANAPSDVVVRIDGEPVQVDAVFGRTGEITLVNQPRYDPLTEKYIPAKIPTKDSEVVVSYFYNRNLIQTGLDQSTQFCYRLTTVALDSSSPTGYRETPLSWSPPIFLSNVETMDYIWREGIRRNKWILEQGGERVKVFKRKVSGVPCSCGLDDRMVEVNKQPSSRCLQCFGSGWVGGFDGPYDLLIGPDDGERRVTQTPSGRRLEHTYEVWTGPSPALTQRDFLVKQTGERYSIGAVRRPSVKGLVLQQHFNIGYLDESDIRYRVPLLGSENLPWAETRNLTDGAPYPIGADYVSTPMETDKASIPAGRQQRGRTVNWSNNTY